MLETDDPRMHVFANEVAIKIGGHKLAQLPRFVLGLGNDVRMCALPHRGAVVLLMHHPLAEFRLVSVDVGAVALGVR